ncbi:MAG TPA: ABC transporter ATP-binding protein [Streptosporangiaceae bacterium]|nr:ABC transporter ATP-binding protein [Streptosporangiaceae bacterium]
MPVIEVRGLTKRFGRVLAVDRLDFDVEPGSVVGFLGPNGAGKTTTLRMVLGLVKPDSGTATINGQTYRELADPLRQVGAVLEASSFHPGRTARNHLRVHAMAGGVPRSRVEEVLEAVDLSQAAGRRIGGFSLGMRQRLGLATALLAKPEVLILDEPANGLDPEGVRWLRDLVRGLTADGTAVLVSSHILAEVAHTVDSVVILNHGRLVTQSSLTELMAGVEPSVRVRTDRSEELQAFMAADGAQARLLAPGQVEITGTTPERVAAIASERSISLVESVTHLPDLEDVFLRLIADKSRASQPALEES